MRSCETRRYPNTPNIFYALPSEHIKEALHHVPAHVQATRTAATRLVLHDGAALLGRVISTDTEQVRLIVVGNRNMDVPRADIKTGEPVMESFMWPWSLEGLSEAEVDALLTYVVSLYKANEPGI